MSKVTAKDHVLRCPVSAKQTTTSDTNNADEQESLVKKVRHSKVLCRRRTFCIHNRAALLILLWNFLLSMLGVLLTPRIYLSLFTADGNFVAITCGTYGTIAALFLFYPLAGSLADIKFGRYKVVSTTLWLIWLSLLITVPLVGLGVLVYHYHPFLIWLPITIGCVAAVVVFVGFIGFSANVIQFGMDQLHDAPSDHSSLFIYWYVWGYFLATSISKPILSGTVDSTCEIKVQSVVLISAILLAAFVALGVSLCLSCFKKNVWFLVESGARWNPYQLVYRVLKFAVQHKNPVRRSAFTFCEDDLPSRIDFGKTKYGGPYTTEEVEDVKVLLGIVCVLLALGPSFATETAANALLPTFAQHLQNTTTNDCFSKLVIDNGTLTSIAITVIIPTYLFFIRPYVRNYVPGMLKRMGLGMVFSFLSLLVTFFTDTAGHAITNANATCLLSSSPGSTSDFQHLDINSHVVILQSFLNSISYMLLYIASYEFICAQSPHSMKGLLIGAFFAINGLFHLLSVLGIFLPFTFWKLRFPSCSFGYYLTSIFVSFVGLVIYTCVARRYKLRERDEPSRIHIYAEEYYEKAQDEPNYDYDDYDNLNVHTIVNNS